MRCSALQEPAAMSESGQLTQIELAFNLAQLES